MKFDEELAQLADLLRVGAQTARTIAAERGRHKADILRLAAQADAMSDEIDGIVDDRTVGGGDAAQPAPSLRLRPDK